jgi:nitronate monooxygenase
MFGTELPIVLAPMAGFGTVELAIAVANAGGLGSLALASVSTDEAANQIAAYRACGKPLNVNFFCHAQAIGDDSKWRAKLAPYYAEFAITIATPGTPRHPFDEAACKLVEQTKPEVVSFHFGLPPRELLARVKATGARVISSATTVREAVWLAERGCDAIIAQGAEAGGHRGMFLVYDVAAQVGTFALVPQIVDAVRVPVIAAGGIADARGIVAAFALGASAVQLGTAYLACPEAKVAPIHRAALATATDDSTVITNVFSGRPARGIVNRAIRELGPMSDVTPPFPLASTALAPIRAKAEAAGSGDFTNLWAGQAAHISFRARAGEPAFELTKRLARETHELRRRLAER